VSSPDAATIPADPPAVERVQLDEHSWVDIVRAMLPDPCGVFEDLRDRTTWEQGRVFRYERWIDEPRLGSFKRYERLGAVPQPPQPPQPPPTDLDASEQPLHDVRAWVSRRYGVHFDGHALALYRDGRDSVAWHRDRELKWLDETVIAVLSLGSQRPWLMRPLTGRRGDTGDDAHDMSDVIDIHPAGGDLLVMGGRCQAAWLHCVPKLSTAGPRISVQWRWTSRRGRRDPNPSYFAARHFARR
jgi:alkylated DNA repair dioxygenase AlkB